MYWRVRRELAGLGGCGARRIWGVDGLKLHGLTSWTEVLQCQAQARLPSVSPLRPCVPTHRNYTKSRVSCFFLLFLLVTDIATADQSRNNSRSNDLPGTGLVVADVDK